MIRLRSAVKHRPLQASKFSSAEIYGVPACFAVNHTDTMYHGTKSSIQDRFQKCELPNYNQNNLGALIIEASPLLRKLSSISVEPFHDFAFVFYKHVNRFAQGFQRLDAVSDHYFSNSLMSQTRMGQTASGTFVLHINDDIPFPQNLFNSFLFNSTIKNYIGLY